MHMATQPRHAASSGECHDPRRHRHDRVPAGDQHRPDGPARRCRDAPLPAAAVPHRADLSQPQGPRRRRAARHRRRAAAGPRRARPGRTAAAAVAGHAVRGCVWQDACRYYEFRVLRSTSARSACASRPRWSTRAGCATSSASTGPSTPSSRPPSWPRAPILPLDEIEAEYRKLAVIVDKTGGDQEQQAFAFLRRHVERVAAARASPGNDGSRHHDTGPYRRPAALRPVQPAARRDFWPDRAASRRAGAASAASA